LVFSVTKNSRKRPLVMVGLHQAVQEVTQRRAIVEHGFFG